MIQRGGKNIAKVYIVLFQTGTLLSKICRRVTKKEYNHASITVDPTLEIMYSFGRLWAHNPVIGGFVQEGIRTGTFKRFSNTVCYVMEIDVTDEQYEALQNNLDRMIRNRRRYTYNYLGLVAAAFNRRLSIWHMYYCSEFVYKVLMDSGIDAGEIPHVYYPMGLMQTDHRMVYRGLLSSYEFS